jgi:hypothetical protein
VVNYEVLQRICDGLGIPRGAMGLAHTTDRSPAADDTTIDGPAQPLGEVMRNDDAGPGQGTRPIPFHKGCGDSARHGGA